MFGVTVGFPKVSVHILCDCIGVLENTVRYIWIGFFFFQIQARSKGRIEKRFYIQRSLTDDYAVHLHY